ncbi:MAG: DUF4434 domain-containing protein [Eubacteriales bacterium]|nr:DUF4434 domain-containing protein [Eubacteriales bacterium]
MKLKRLFRFILTFISLLITASSCQISGGLSEVSDSLSKDTSSTMSEVPEESKVELPFTPIQRPKLLADSMPALCEPLPSGDFIQPWYCATWSVSQWEMYLKVIKRAGLDFVILQGTSDRKDGKYIGFSYPSEMASDSNLSASNVYVTEMTVANLLEAAKKNDMQVYLGIGGDNKWWNYAFSDLSWCTKEAELANRTAEELYNLYKKDYPETFAGWYWTWEMFSAKDKYEVNWSKMISITLDKLTELDHSMPCIFSPFYSSYEEPDLERVSEQWTYLLKNTAFREGDIFCPQDNIGIHSKDYGDEAKGAKYSITFMENIVRALKEATEKNPKVRFWLNVENFNDGKPASIARYADQLDIASKYAEKLITFSYAHYYSPINVDVSYNKQFLQYKKWIEQNPQTEK